MHLSGDEFSFDASRSKLQLTVGDLVCLDENETWESSNDDVIKLVDSRLVLALNEGQASIKSDRTISINVKSPESIQFLAKKSITNLIALNLVYIQNSNHQTATSSDLFESKFVDNLSPFKCTAEFINQNKKKWKN